MLLKNLQIKWRKKLKQICNKKKIHKEEINGLLKKINK